VPTPAQLRFSVVIVAKALPRPSYNDTSLAKSTNKLLMLSRELVSACFTRVFAYKVLNTYI